MIFTNQAGRPRAQSRGGAGQEHKCEGPAGKQSQHHLRARAAPPGFLYEPIDSTLSLFLIWALDLLPTKYTPTWPVNAPLVTLPQAEITLLQQFLFLMWAEGVPTIRVSGSFVLLGLPGPRCCFQRVLASGSFRHVRLKLNLSQEFCCFISVIYGKLVLSVNKDNGKFQNLKIIKLSGQWWEKRNCKIFPHHPDIVFNNIFPRSNYKQKCNLPSGIFWLQNMKLFQEDCGQRVLSPHTPIGKCNLPAPSSLG